MKAPEVEGGELWGGGSAPNIDLLKQKMDLLFNLNRFDNARVNRICKAAGVTLEGLCAMAGVFGKAKIRALQAQADRQEAEERRRKEVRHRTAWHKKKKAPSLWKWPWEIALHFAKIEKFLFEQRLQSPTGVTPDEVAVAEAVTQALDQRHHFHSELVPHN